MGERLDRRKLFLKVDLLRDYLAAVFIRLVCARMSFRSNDPVKPAVDELDRAVVFNRNPDAPSLPNHLAEVLSPGHSSSSSLVVGAMDPFDKPHNRPLHAYLSHRLKLA